jgi:hypothetical protein
LKFLLKGGTLVETTATVTRDCAKQRLLHVNFQILKIHTRQTQPKIRKMLQILSRHVTLTLFLLYLAISRREMNGSALDLAR